MVKECNFAGCTKKIVTRGLCSGHYQQLIAGKPLKPLREIKKVHKDENGRVCTRCNHYKPWSAFYTNTNGTRRSQCRDCQIKANTVTNRLRLCGQAEPIRERHYKGVN